MKKLPIFHLVFPNQYLLASSLLRFQEHYESPKFRGKVFSLEEFMDWYARDRGSFSYFEDWGGFNFPGNVLDVFSTYSSKETLVKTTLAAAVRKAKVDSFYVLGTSAPGVLNHEMVHGLYYTNSTYAVEVNRLCLAHREELEPLRAWLQDVAKYHRKVWYDEMNAYLLTGLPAGLSKLHDSPVAKFHALFCEHHGFDPSNLSDSDWVKARTYTLNMGWRLKKLRYT